MKAEIKPLFNAVKNPELNILNPLIIKENYGSCGKGIYLARNREELEQIANEIKLKPHLYQAFIKESQGIRLVI